MIRVFIRAGIEGKKRDDDYFNNKIEKRKIRKEIRELILPTDQSGVPITNSAASIQIVNIRFLKIISI